MDIELARWPALGAALLLALGACGGAAETRAPRTAAAIAPRAAPHTKQALPPPWSNVAVEPAPPPASVAGSRVLETAERMVDDGTVVRGSCHRYIETVYDSAGYRGWRRRSVIFRGNRNGPYADLDLIQPGDWLYIVNHPELTPVGTHSVIFMGWEDRARGYARVVSYVGGMQDRPGDIVGYDVSLTYRITRPVDEEPRTARAR